MIERSMPIAEVVEKLKAQQQSKYVVLNATSKLVQDKRSSPCAHYEFSLKNAIYNTNPLPSNAISRPGSQLSIEHHN